MDERRRMWRLAGRYSSTGIEMAVAVAFCSIGGHWLDEALETEPWLTSLGILLGLTLAVKTVLRVVQNYQEDSRR